ncbi:nesprin-1 [Nematolebias whitei]|uniref:nesprin-1 n=1 Tax=Nematolebias whitei TaxID=451745 RepID=UPI00189BC897|nr:nesprin-1 [Nematolebias whitei]
MAKLSFLLGVAMRLSCGDKVRISVIQGELRVELLHLCIQKTFNLKARLCLSAQCVPPLEVKDLFQDIKDGVMLLALLEVLSGQKLPCEQGKKLKRIHWVANIGTALKFLEGRKSAYRGSPIKLVNINSTDIVDGRPSIVLGLVWTIILYFQIEELTSSLPELQASSSSTSSVDSSTSSIDTTSPPVKRKPLPPLQGGARKALLRWVQQTATKRLGLEVKDFGPSWRTGLAFFAVINALRPNLVDMEQIWRRPNRENLHEAFKLAETELGIPQLLDPEDVDVDKPDEKSVMTYVAQFLRHHSDRKQSDSEGRHDEEREQRKSLRELRTWLDQLESEAARAQETEANLAQQYQLFKSLHVQVEMRRKQVEGAFQSTQRDGMLTVDQALVKQAWERVSNRLVDWHLQLDRSLPAPLDTVGAWLHEAEGALRHEIVVQQAHDITANTVHRALEQHKDVLKSLESHQQVFQRIHKDRSVDGVPVPPDQLQDMAERMNFVSTSSSVHLARMEYLENKHHMQAFLTLVESKLKSWIIKYGRHESVELMLNNYIELLNQQQSCKRCVSVVERNHYTLQRMLTNSKVLRNFDLLLLQKRVAEIQGSLQALLKEVGERRRQEEANNCLRRRFEESRQELERVLKKAQGCLKETGDAEELLKKHSDFFGQVDQRVLSMFLKACDELTDILPQEEQEGLQETVRRLHKHWKDLQAEVPSHLLHLKVDVERNRVALILRDCREELDREIQALSGTCTSERVIKEHNTFFKERKPLTLCEKRIRNMEDLCQKLPDNDAAYRILDSTRMDVEEVKEQIKITHLKLEQHPDKWKEWNERFCELSDWLSSQKAQVMLLRESPMNSRHQEHVDAAVQGLQQAVNAREGSLLWLKSRLAGLSEVSPEVEVQRQRAALAKLSTDLRALLSSLCQLGEEGTPMFQYEELRDNVRGALEEVLKTEKEAEEQMSRILNAESLEEAKQLYLIHQQHLQRLDANRKEAEVLVSHCHQLQTGEELSQHLQELEGAFSAVDFQSGATEHNLQETLSSWQNFEMEREAVWRFLTNADNEVHKQLIFNSLTSLRSELEHNKELFIKFEEYSVRADALLEMAADIQLGPKNQGLLVEQAQSTREAVAKLEKRLEENFVLLQKMFTQWERFSSESEALSQWINEREKELEAVCFKSSSDPLDKHISTVEMGEGLAERRAALAQMEADSETLSRFVTPGEAGHVRARLVQTRRRFDELMERTEQLGEQLNLSASYRQRCNNNLDQVKKVFSDLKGKLDFPISYCTSSSETYKILQDHMEVCQGIEQLKPRLMALGSAAKRLGEGGQLEEEVADLQRQQRQLVGKAADKQSSLESLLALWQRYEKETASMKGWLGRCESLCCPDTELLSADKVKLRHELQHVQGMHGEAPTYEVLLQGLANLQLCLNATAPEARVQELSDDFAQLKERYTSVKSSIGRRCKLLEMHLDQVEQFYQTLLLLTERSENFLSDLRSSSSVDISNLEAAVTELKEHEARLEEDASLVETLHQRESGLVCRFTPEARQQLEAWREDCLQPLSESQRLLLVRKMFLTELKVFLEKYETVAKAVCHLREAVEGRGSWDHSKAEELHCGIVDVTKDVARLEAEAVGLDGQLSKAHLHLCGAELTDSEDNSCPQGRTSCRGQAVVLTMALEGVQRAVGWRQSEADALGVLWCSFRERKEEVMKSLKKLEDDGSQEEAREFTVQAFQSRLRFFVQLEDELQSLQHSQRWLEEKGTQLAQKDSELAAEALREVTLVKTAWDNVKTLITNSQEQSGVVVDLLRLMLHLKSVLTAVVENAQAVAHNLPDHNHNAQDARSAFTQHEIVHAELREKQEDMDQLISTVEDLQRELEKVPNSKMFSIQAEMEALRDQWLLVSEKIQTNTERLGYCAELWDDLKALERDINQWTAASVTDLTGSVARLGDVESAEALLAIFQAELEKREQRFNVVQARVAELKERAKLQETPIQMQVLESDLRKKMFHAQEAFNQAKHTLTYFNFQKQRLEDLMSQMAERLEGVEGSISDLSEASSLEHIQTVKDLQVVVQQQRADMDSARDVLTSLSRSQPSQELSRLSSDLTSIAKRTEAVAQRCAKTRSSLQDGLQLHFNELVQDFKSWLADLKLELKDCFNQSGDVAILGAKLQRLKLSAEQTSEGEERLSQVCKEAENLQLHLSKAGAAQVQENCSSCQKEWKNYLDSRCQSQQYLQESIDLLKK